MKIKFFLIIFVFIGLLSCKTSQLIHSSTSGNELFKVAILYPNGEGKTFDMEYYETKHMPMVAGFLGKMASGILYPNFTLQPPPSPLPHTSPVPLPHSLPLFQNRYQLKA